MNTRSANGKGMTLLETVIAIGVIAVAVPLVLAATGASMADRMNAEADTKSAWLAKNVEEQVAAIWATPRQPSDLPKTLNLDFPVTGTEADPVVLIYDQDLNFVAEGGSSDFKSGSKLANARFLVAIHSTAQAPGNLTTTSPEMARLFLRIESPAKAPDKKRQSNKYSILMPKQPAF